MHKGISSTKTTDINLPLFVYSQKFENFDTFESFDAYFIHCINTSGTEKNEIAKSMGLSPSGLSLRMNQVGYDGPRFTTHHIQAYIDLVGDPRPSQYLKWRQERAAMPEDTAIMEMVNRLNTEVKKLNGLLETKINGLTEKGQ